MKTHTLLYRQIFCFIIFLISSFSFAQGNVTTIAGSTQGYSDGTGTVARFVGPNGLVVDAFGNIFVADTYNHKIRKITPAGVVTTIAGSSNGSLDGVGTGAQFNYPVGITLDAANNIYVTEHGSHRIRKISSTGVVTTFAGSTQGYLDGTGTAARFSGPTGIALDAANNIYVADSQNNRIRKITPAGVVTTFAGSTQGHSDGTGTAAQFSGPTGIAIDGSNNIYVSSGSIRKITPTGVVTTIVGSAEFNFPHGLDIDIWGNLYVADYFNHRIRKVAQNGTVTTIAGNLQGFLDGNFSIARFNQPSDVAVDSSGNLYVADTYNNRIRKITGAVLSNTSYILEKEFTIYPNPTNSMFNVEIPNDSVKAISVVDVMGKVVASSNVATVDVSNLSSGIYVVKVETESGKTGTQKLVKD